ncbi:MAG: DNA replication and repair protein RecF, partial [Chloroflexi bacterium]|nr:DNA replication and repair protein RecF [Chloroflexota bacterium]
ARHAAPVRKRIRVNEVPRRAADVLGQFNVVMFTSGDMDLITGTPDLCRRYLNLVNCQTDWRYLKCLQRYNRVLVPRNHLLRMLQEHRSPAEQMEFWDRELAENGSYITVQRQHLVTKLNDLARGIHLELSSRRGRLDLVYGPNVGIGASLADTQSRFLGALHQARSREISQGTTLVGPHRDSLRFHVGGADVRGQQQTAVISLKLAEAQYMHAEVGDAPVLLLDDVFSELDQARRKHLLEAITGFQQVLVTAVDLDWFPAPFLAEAVKLRVREGTIESV